MSFQLQESLNKIKVLKEANAAKPEGERIADKTFDLMEKMTRNLHGDVFYGESINPRSINYYRHCKTYSKSNRREIKRSCRARIFSY